MVSPTRYTQDMFDEHFSNGVWTEDTTWKLWARNAKLYPDKEAFVDFEKRLTWRQVQIMSDSIALNLLDLGLKKDEFIFLLLPNWAESFILRCAFEKAGILCGTALMTLREREIEYILKSFDASGIVIPLTFRNFNYFDLVEKLRPQMPRLKHIFLVSDETPPGTISLKEMIRQPRTTKSSEDIFQKTGYQPTDVSVIGFTSGTTGTPKGAEHIIASRIAMARGYGEPAKVCGDDVILNIISAVAGLSSAFCYNGTATLVGAKVVLSDIWSPEKTFELIEREKVTILLSVPAQLAQIVNHTGKDNFDLSTLRCIYSSTAPLSYDLAKSVEETLMVPCINLYGQIDGGFISAPNIDDPPEIRRRTVGRPHRHTRVWILDDDGNEVPAGENGELVYTGPSTTGGYYRNLEDTLKVWGVLGRGGRCKSGDIVHMDDEGHLVLVGRKKEMINRGGMKIYPAEIEGLLLTHHKVQAVAIVPMPDPIMGEKACAYVQLTPGNSLTFEEMIEFLKMKKIAPYKLPERLEIREELPLKGRQKVAKAQLRDDIFQRLKEEGAHRPQL